MITFRVDVTLEDSWWTIRVPGLLNSFDDEAILTQAERYDEIEAQARDLIAVSTGIDGDRFDIELFYASKDLQVLFDRFQAEREGKS
ncbi:HicB-like antitoxin [Gordonia phage Skog]|uniref:HicB-like antitoxin n=1 Tax=Gordonia phage Skog TaxID=2704033 RepID=A0A6G6XJK3_9CAUD|nr:HicB-like antitoxin [Gordonia phage Skog]QIG58206.1 HicB-like antitoxin [Gordonia phage Skog]